MNDETDAADQWDGNYPGEEEEDPSARMLAALVAYMPEFRNAMKKESEEIRGDLQGYLLEQMVRTCRNRPDHPEPLAVFRFIRTKATKGYWTRYLNHRKKLELKPEWATDMDSLDEDTSITALEEKLTLQAMIAQTKMTDKQRAALVGFLEDGQIQKGTHTSFDQAIEKIQRKFA